jgi:chemotaxis family two-component system response regulator Rcp1
VIVEDNSADIFLIKEAMAEAGVGAELHVLHDGESATMFFDELDASALPCPALVILDINLPKKHGGEVLKHLRHTHRCGTTLVITVSTSDSNRDREAMRELGANAYFTKPSEYEDFLKLGELIRGMIASTSPSAPPSPLAG